MRKFTFIIFLLFLLFAAFYGLIQTDWAKGKMHRILNENLERAGFQVKVEKIEGSVPHEIRLEGVSLIGNGLDFQAKKLEFKLSLLRLLRKELAFTYLDAEGVSWHREEGLGGIGEPKDPLERIPFKISVEQFHLKQVTLPDLFPINLKGRLRLGKSRGLLETEVTRPEFPTSSLHLTLRINREKISQLSLDLNTPTLKVIPISFSSYRSATDFLATSRLDGDLQAHLRVKGPWYSFWQNQGELEGSFQGQWNDTIFSSPLVRNKDGSILLSKISLKSELLNFKGNAQFDAALQLTQAEGKVQSSRLLPFLLPEAKGFLTAQINLIPQSEGKEIHAKVQIPSLAFEESLPEWKKILRLPDSSSELPISNFEVDLTALWNQKTLHGSATLTTQFLGELWKGKTDFSWAIAHSLFLKELQVEAPSLRGSADLEIRPEFLLIGSAEATAENLQSLHFPDLYGSAELKANWSINEEKQTQVLTVGGTATDLYYHSFFSHKLSLYSNFSVGTFDLNLEKSRWGELHLEEGHLAMTPGTFQIEAVGKFKHPLEMQMNGSWSYTNSEFLTKVDAWKGTFFNHAFQLSHPIQLDWTPTLFHLPNLEISLADAALFLTIDRRADITDAKIILKNVPLDFLSLNPLDLSILGSLNLEAKIHEEEGKMHGDLQANVIDVEVAALGAEDRLEATGKIEGHFDRDRLLLKGNLAVRDEPLLKLDLSVPIHLSLWPFQADLLLHKEAKGDLFLDGRIEDVLDFFDTGTHRLQGECTCDLHLRNTLYRPIVEGYCHFENGSYQNYYTGTALEHIQADWLAEKETLYLRSFQAKDGKEGNISATGEVHLRAGDLFPFQFDLQFSNLNALSMDLVTADADGKLQITGNQRSALAKGTVEVTRSDISIPDHVPRPLPQLQVIYKNATQPIQPPEIDPPHPYPLFLDIQAGAPDGILINGRGLNSEWKGKFHIGGTSTALSTKGKLELLQGKFNVSVREFKLSEGSLLFSGHEHETPYLNIAGTMETKGIVILARLQGPLNNPQVTFQSTPALPLGSIMSYLLFGQDISEISGFQALELATSLAALSSEGPGIMESTRRSLGVDRLRVISSPMAGKEGEGTIALQVGKYVADGVLISYTQGATDSSGNISIEVELKDNFVFQAETQQQPEQGKFTLKWNLNY